MNIFFLSLNPVDAAQYQCDKHVVKMILETAQLLCTAHRVLDGVQLVSETTGKLLQKYRHPDTEMDDLLYKSTHINHPSSKWVRKTSGNYMWAYCHFLALCEEYEHRYGRQHASLKLADVLFKPPTFIDDGLFDISEDVIAINEDIDKEWGCRVKYKGPESIVESYRRYYLYKSTVVSPFNFTNRTVPEFMLDFGFDIGAEFTAQEAPWKVS